MKSRIESVQVAEKPRVVRSINAPGDGRCVDVFVRTDGTFGFEEYRRDAEDQRGWFPVGFFGDRVFESEQESLEEACERLPWLRHLLKEP